MAYYENFQKIFPFPLEPLSFETGKIQRDSQHAGPATTVGDVNRAFKRLRQLQREGQRKGYTPVLLKLSDILLEAMSFNIEDALGVDSKTVSAADLGEYARRELAAYRTRAEEGSARLAQHVLAEKYRGMSASATADFYRDPAFSLVSDPAATRPAVTYSVLTYGAAIEDEFAIAKVPVSDPADIPAYIPCGGWNDCPDTSEQLAVLHYWQQQYGARIIALGRDEMELFISRPVQQLEQARRAGAEQVIFCSDADTQVYSSFTQLVHRIYRNHYWYFWWD